MIKYPEDISNNRKITENTLENPFMAGIKEMEHSRWLQLSYGSQACNMSFSGAKLALAMMVGRN